MTPAEESARASRQVAAIVEAAERAADALRMETERRADERIAEAARAADARVQAAEAEGAEIVAEAQRRAAVLHETAEADGARIRRDAEGAAAAILQEAREQAGEVQRIAEVFAAETRRAAEEDGARRVRRARELADEVLAEGTKLSHHLRQLSDSLRTNAMTLLDDVGNAHRALVARLDDEPGAGRPPARPDGSDVTDVPEFIPATPRRR